MKRYNKILLLLFVFLFSLSAQNRYNDIKIIESNNNYLLIEYIPSFDSLITIHSSSEIFHYLGFKNSFPSYTNKIGYPDIHSRNISLGFPSIEGNNVEIISSSFEIIKNVKYKPVKTPFKSYDDSIGFNGDLIINENAYRKNEFYPLNIFELDNIGIARDKIIGTLKIYPIQFNPFTGELKKYTTIRLKINFGTSRNIISGTSNNINSLGNQDVLRNIILNYEQSLSWNYKPSQTKINAVKNSVFSSGTWYKIEIKEDGIYKLDANFFKNAGISLSGVDPRTIKIYGNGGGELSEIQESDVPTDPVECAIYASGEDDGVFNDNDYFLFYAQGPDKWVYDAKNKKFRHFINHYTTSNYYFLTFGGSERGKRVTTFTSAITNNPIVLQNLPDKCYIEPEKYNVNSSGRQWYGTALSSAFPSTNYISPKLDGILNKEKILYRFVCAAASNDQSYFRIEQNNQLIGNVYVYYPISTYITMRTSDTTEFIKDTSNIIDGKINLKVTYVPNSTSDKGCFDWVEVFYKRSLSTTIDEIKFTTPDTNGVIEYNLSGFSNSNIFVFNVQDHNNIKLLSNPTINAGNIKFLLQANSGIVYDIFVVGTNGLKSPASISKLTNTNIHGYADGAEMIIIVPNDKDFIAQAERYKQFRENSKYSKVKCYIANLENIYNEFSSGKVDVTAIRNFIRYAYLNWVIKPKYVLLMGDGIFDYKNIINNNNFSQLNRVPVYEVEESNDIIESYVTDDYYTRIIGNDLRADLSIGRIPAITVKNLTSFIDKVIAYENSEMSSWRKRLTFIADDGLTSDPNRDDGSDHTNDSETLAEYYSPKQFDKNKIYIINYKTVISSLGRTKPDANKDIIKAFNDGTLLINYIGHGNPRVWAHESIMRNETTIPALSNKNKYPFVIAATCDFGRYDDPTEQSGTELFVTKENAGAIGVFSASRSVYASDNYEINREFIVYLFTRVQNTELMTLGDIMYLIKQDFYSSNDSKFHLFSDPSLKLSIPYYFSDIDSINNFDARNTINLKALQKVNLKGIVRSNNVFLDNYNGKMQVTIYDAPKTIDISEGIGRFVFEQPGGIIYSGECSIKNGKFETNFFIPKDISYENKNGKISMYFYNPDKDGYGYNSNIIINGTDTTNIVDVNGPVINIYLNDRNFRNGDLVGENPLVIIDLYDESGINTTGLGIGHRFEAYLDNSTEGIPLNNYYKGKIDSYTEGTVEYQLQNLSNGNHKLKVKVYDIFNNASTNEVTFKVYSQQSLKLMNVMNYPNPFSKSTKFTMQQNQDEPIDITIKIYTVSGRLIKVINEYGITSKFVQIDWDGKDEDGDDIANGVYLYKVITKTQDGKLSDEVFGKLSVLK